MDWTALGNAISFYETKGFKYIEVPWYTTSDVIELTWPSDKPRVFDLQLSVGPELIASAEQGFISLALRNELPYGRYVSCSPCFRVEPVYDAIHHPYFMKVELYSSTSTKEELEFLIQSAEEWFKQYGICTNRVFFDNGSIDLESNSIELGSYGIRHLDKFSFIYATGHAEPRASYVKSLSPPVVTL